MNEGYFINHHNVKYLNNMSHCDGLEDMYTARKQYQTKQMMPT